MTPAWNSTRWLLSHTPGSKVQARLGRIYMGWLTFRSNPIGMTGLVIVALLVAVAILAPWLSEHTPFTQSLPDRLRPPSHDHWFGTDELGRDIFSRIVHGTRITLLIVCLVVIVAAPLGLVVGSVSGYFGGWLDIVAMRITDIVLAFPRLILALAFVAALGPGLENAVIAIAVTAWPPYARIARAETMTIRHSDFINAARLQGATHFRVITCHVFPMCASSLIIRVSLDMAGIILTAAGLGFLGLGAQPPAPEWGAMVSSGRQFMLDQWWVAAIPGLAILIVSLGFNLLGDGLRDVLDPRSH